MEIREHPPDYDDLVASIPSNRDERADVANAAPTHMAVNMQPKHSGKHGAQLPRRSLPPMTLVEHVQEQGLMMEWLSSKFDRLVESIIVSAETVPPGGAY
jgi:hypothetical protein